MAQGSTVLPTVGTITGLAEQGLINAALLALLTNNSGGSAPANPQQFQFWADTSVGGQITLRQFMGSAWVPIWTADTSSGLIALGASLPQNWAAAGGTHDAIAATYDPPITSAQLVDGLTLAFRATSANLTTTPTFAPNGLTAHTITKNGGQALAIGDIPGANAEIVLRYNLANTRWELQGAPDVPVGGMVPYFGGSVPAGFALPQGQNLSATTFPAANAVLGTIYGSPGGGNFTMPDLRGRFFYNLDTSTGRLSLIGGTALGAAAGSQSQAITQSNLPAVNFNVSGINLTNGTPTMKTNIGQDTVAGGNTAISTAGINSANTDWSTLLVNFALTTNVSVATQGSAASGGGGVALPTIPPCMGINCMMRIA